MSEWLKVIVSLTVAGSTVTIGMLLFRHILPKSFSAKWQYLINKAALLFYLLPILLVKQQLSLFFASSKSISQSSKITSESMLELTPVVSFIPAEIGWTIFSIWAGGAAIFAGWHMYCYCRFIRQLNRSSTPILYHNEITELVAVYRRKLGITTRVKLAFHNEIGSPVLVKLFNPTILLPKGSSQGVDLGMVIHHELIHLKRKDLWVKILVLFASAIHWFNPLVHILRKHIHVWSELSCDEEVVKEMSHVERKRYGATILNLLEKAAEVPAAYSASLSENALQLKERLMRLMNRRARNKYSTAITFATIIAITVLGTATPAWAAKYIPSIESNISEVWAPTVNITIENPVTSVVSEEHIKLSDIQFSEINTLEESLEVLHPVTVEEFESSKIIKNKKLETSTPIKSVEITTDQETKIEQSKSSPAR